MEPTQTAPVATETPTQATQATPEAAPEGKQATPEVKPESQSQESFSKRFAALNRERKMISEREAALKREAAKIEAEKSEVQKWREQQQQIKEAKNPLEALKAFGFSYEDAANYMLNDNRPTPDLMIKGVEEKMMSKVQELEAKLQAAEQEKLQAQQRIQEETLQKTNQQAIDTIKTHLSANPDYDALIELGMQDDIFNKINSHYMETGEVLEINEVANEYLTQVEQMLEKIQKTKVFNKKFGKKEEPKPMPTATTNKTLNSSLHAQTKPVDKGHYKTDEERIRNALALLSK